MSEEAAIVTAPNPNPTATNSRTGRYSSMSSVDLSCGYVTCLEHLKLRGARGTVKLLRRLRSVHLLDRLGERRHHLEQVPHDAVVGHLEDGCVAVLVDRHDAPRRGHAGEVLHRSRDADGDIELRAHRLAGLTHLVAVRPPARVHDRARRADGGAQRIGE